MPQAIPAEILKLLTQAERQSKPHRTKEKARLFYLAAAATCHEHINQPMLKRVLALGLGAMAEGRLTDEEPLLRRIGKCDRGILGYFETVLREQCQAFDLTHEIWAIGTEQLTPSLCVRSIYSYLLGHNVPPATEGLERVKLGIQELVESYGPPATELNQIRHQFKAEIEAAVKTSPGFFYAPGPTGIGKTNAGLSAAVEHALQNGQGRIHYLSPSNAILNQSRDQIIGIAGADNVTTHYGFSSEGISEKQKRRRWGTAVVVTSVVQFFDGLFSDRPQKNERFSQIENSVILIDEAQSMPVRTLAPSLEALKALVADWGCSVIFLTATQPDFSPWGIEPACLVKEPQHYADSLKRVEYLHLSRKLTWEELCLRVKNHPQALIGVNTTRAARDCAEALRRHGVSNVIVYTNMVRPSLRPQKMQEIEARLEAGLPVIVVATSCIEAGVDLDFPAGFRMFGSIFNFVQMGGRVNRSPKELGETKPLYIFDIDDEDSPYRLPHELGMGKTTTARLLEQGVDLQSHDVMRVYCEELYGRMAPSEFDKGGVMEMLQPGESLDLGMASSSFNQILSTPSVVFLNPADINGSMEKIVGKDSAYLAENSVNQYHSQIEKLEANGLVAKVGSSWVVVGHINEDGAVDMEAGPDPDKVAAALRMLEEKAA